jgi:hypothetical protein
MILSNLFLGSEPVIPISPWVGRLKIKEWMTPKHSKYRAATPAMKQSSSLRSLRKNCLRTYWPWTGNSALVTGLSTGHCTLRRHLHVMCLLDNTMCRKCEQMEKSSYCVLCECPALTGHGINIFGSAYLGPIDIGRASIKQVLALALSARLF